MIKLCSKYRRGCMKVEDVIKLYNSYTKSLIYMVNNNGNAQSKDDVIFSMIQLLKKYLDEVKQSEDEKTFEEVKPIFEQRVEQRRNLSKIAKIC